MSIRPFDAVTVGDDLPPRARIVSADDVRTYAEAGGDQNPLHQDEAVARAAGFPGIIAHGMFTLGHLASAIADWAGDAGAVASLTAQFRAPVFMGETIFAGGRIVAADPDARTVTIDVWVTLERDGDTEYPVRKGQALVRLA